MISDYLRIKKHSDSKEFYDSLSAYLSGDWWEKDNVLALASPAQANAILQAGGLSNLFQRATGDMPTPIKYHSTELHQAFQEVENLASEQLLDMLPEDMRSYYENLFFHGEGDEYLWKLVKAADKISAYCKCIEEEKSGNTEFRKAKQAIRDSLLAMSMCEISVFMPSFEMTLDEL